VNSPETLIPGTQADPVFATLLRFGDDNLVLAQRLSEWVSRGPELEEDIALGNLALDHLGQARLLLSAAARLEGEGRTEDDLAMWRDETAFTNLLLVEQPNGDFAHTMVRQNWIDAYQVALWHATADSTSPDIAAVAAKAAKEAAYHHRHSTTWIRRLAGGTIESHARLQAAVDDLWRFTAELFEDDVIARAAADAGVAPLPSSLEAGWRRDVVGLLEEGGITVPDEPAYRLGGRTGRHTEHLGHLLAEMQWLARSHPGASW